MENELPKSTYLQCKERVAKLDDAIAKLNETDPDYGRWLRTSELLSTLCGLFGVIQSDTRDTQNLIRKVNNVLFGNGDKEPAMDENLRNLRRDFDKYVIEETERRNKQEDERRFYARAVIIMVITNFVSILGYAVFWFSRYAPVLEKIVDK